MDSNTSGWIIFIAILGAAAWIPHLISIIIKIFNKTSVVTINQKEIEIGYTTLGPIINFGLAFLAEKEKALVQKINLTLKHSNNESHLIQWIWYEESLFQMDIQKASIPYKKNQIAIALNIAKDSMVEKKIGFQCLEFKTIFDRIVKIVQEGLANLKNNNEELDKIKSKKGYNDLIDHLNNLFIWKIGNYLAEIEIFVLRRKSPFKHMLKFELNNLDLRKLKDNIQVCKESIDNILISSKSEYEPKWNWVYCNDLKSDLTQIKA